MRERAKIESEGRVAMSGGQYINISAGLGHGTCGYDQQAFLRLGPRNLNKYLHLVS